MHLELELAKSAHTLRKVQSTSEWGWKQMHSRRHHTAFPKLEAGKRDPRIQGMQDEKNCLCSSFDEHIPNHRPIISLVGLADLLISFVGHPKKKLGACSIGNFFELQ